MFILEFVIFVASSGLFYSERFRHHFWAVVIAGAVALGSSLIFVYDVYEKLMVHTEAPVKVVKQVVHVPVIQRVSQPPALSKPENCRDDYPWIARVLGQEGTTEVAFQLLADGTLTGLTISKSSGSDRLDDAAVECVSKWHYRPAIKDGKLVDTPMKVSVAWKLDEGDADNKTGAAR